MYKVILPIRFLVKRPISYFSILGLALCVFVVLVVMTVLTGLNSDFKTATHKSTGDAVITSESLVGFPYYQDFLVELSKQDFVEASTAVIRSYAAIQKHLTGGGFVSFGVKEIYGIEPDSYAKVTGFEEWIQYHESPEFAFQPPYDANEPGIIISAGLILSRDDFGSFIVPDQITADKYEVTCFPLTAKGALARSGTGEVNSKTFFYSDVIQTDVAAIDYSRIYLPFEQAQQLCGMGLEPRRINAIHIKFSDSVSVKAGTEQIKSLWQNYIEQKSGLTYVNLLQNTSVRSWQNQNRLVIAAMETERTMMLLIFSLISLIMVFIIFVIFYMIISHKSKDIGILKSIGISNLNVLCVFMVFAALIGIIGSFMGSFFGWIFLENINAIESWLYENYGFQLWDRTMYAIEEIPFHLDFTLLSSIIVAAILCCLLGAFFPAFKAAKEDPAYSLQVNQL